MTVTAHYEAFWVPGLDHDIDRDDNPGCSLGLGADSVASVVSHVFYRELRYAWIRPREDLKEPSDASA